MTSPVRFLPRNSKSVVSPRSSSDRIPPGLDLKTRQYGHHLSIGINRLWSDDVARTISAEKFEECRVAQVLFRSDPARPRLENAAVRPPLVDRHQSLVER